MKFKIHTKEVRAAAKKHKLRFEQGITLSPDRCCPIGAIYAEKVRDNKDYKVRSSTILQWASKKFGEEYTNGLMAGFDNKESSFYLKFLNKRHKAQFLAGYRNGQLLLKTLLGKEKLAVD